MTRRKPKLVTIPLCDWHWFTPSEDWSDVMVMVRDLKRAGHAIRKERNNQNCIYSRFVIAFYTEEEAALFKLSHL